MWIKSLPEGDKENSIAQSVLNRGFFFKETTIKVSFQRKLVVKHQVKDMINMKDFVSDCTNMEKYKKKKSKLTPDSLSVEKVGLFQYFNYWL